jgi:hypothetical protein
MESKNVTAKNVVVVHCANMKDRSINAKNVVEVLSVHMEIEDHYV